MHGRPRQWASCSRHRGAACLRRTGFGVDACNFCVDAGMRGSHGLKGRISFSIAFRAQSRRFGNAGRRFHGRHQLDLCGGLGFQQWFRRGGVRCQSLKLRIYGRNFAAGAILCVARTGLRICGHRIARRLILSCFTRLSRCWLSDLDGAFGPSNEGLRNSLLRRLIRLGSRPTKCRGNCFHLLDRRQRRAARCNTADGGV